MKQTVYDVSYEGKTVYMRVDYNVPHERTAPLKMTAASVPQYPPFSICWIMAQL